MSSDLTILTGGPAVNQDNGPGIPPINTIQNEINSQSCEVPNVPEVKDQMEDPKKIENNDITIKSSEPKLESEATATSPTIVNEVKETEEMCRIEKPVASEVSNTITSAVTEQPPPIAEVAKTEENAEITSSQKETAMIEENKCIISEKISLKDKEQNENKEELNDTEEEDPAYVDAQELTEQIMNILNDGKNEMLLTSHELLKRNIELQEFILKLVQVLKEKTNLCANLERQNTALIHQAQSLKDVIAITKDLLSIRNMEVEHLHEDLASMENRIKEERLRHGTAVNRCNEAMQLNDKLKTEYLVQMDLFQKLREKYNEKVVMLTRENQRLTEIVKNNNLESSTAPPPEEVEENCNTDENNVVMTSEEISEENVDK